MFYASIWLLGRPLFFIPKYLFLKPACVSKVKDFFRLLKCALN